MAKQRIVNTKFWDDSYITSLDPTEKLIFLYLLTNPLTNISGVYELPLRRAAFDIGVDQSVIENILKKFETDSKMLYRSGWIGIKNFIKHQTLNPKVKQGIVLELKKAPKTITDGLDIDYRSLCISYDSLSNSNSNSNLIPDNSIREHAFIRNRPDIMNKKRDLADKWQVRKY